MADTDVGVGDPVVIELCVQKGTGDCWAAAMKMLLGKTYVEVMNAAPKRCRARHEGLTINQMKRLAKRLGAVLSYTTGAPDEEVVGILDLQANKKTADDHVALWVKGCVVDSSDGLLYTDLAAFLLARDYRCLGYLWRAA